MTVFYTIVPFSTNEGTPFPVSELLYLCVSFSCTDSAYVITGIRYCQNADQEKYQKKSTADAQQAFSASDDLLYAGKIQSELQDYFNKPQFQFSLACDLQLGTPFQQRVWQALTEIPPGEVRTYGELAKELNSSARAVGNACRRNLFPLIVPCHRVVSAAGIGGYAGDTADTQKGQINFLQIKQWLLAHEATAHKKGNDEKSHLK
ncbi:MAG: methylated-DNA--[protein]-cysteine S-methyltransferase [Gammaproteobacteria bacterium]|nr:methylated-DNA--[protein]-cysteine S-methyltransferase [Gammaproteobacteria bacterium]